MVATPRPPIPSVGTISASAVDRTHGGSHAATQDDAGRAALCFGLDKSAGLSWRDPRSLARIQLRRIAGLESLPLALDQFRGTMEVERPRVANEYVKLTKLVLCRLACSEDRVMRVEQADAMCAILVSVDPRSRLVASFANDFV